MPNGRPMYLTEPTEEFKQSESKATNFKRQMLQQKQEFLQLLETFETDPNDETKLQQDLIAMRLSVRKQGGLPTGIPQQDLVKRIRRRKKTTKFWPTSVEIAYQDLLEEIAFLQSPNTEKDMDNPF